VIGVFGGTFDPPHIGHLILADEARGVLSLSAVLWVVTGIPPHKPGQPVTPVSHRIGMVERSIHGNPQFEISRLELDRPGPHFAAETLELLAAAYPDEQWAYVMGEDSLADLPNWHRPERFVQLCQSIVVLRRSQVEADLDQLERQIPGLAAKVRLLEVPLVDISARDIRRRVQTGQPFRYLVTTSVADYIHEHQLYL
jgi:nicotinate-nucleotide adenylyltransferase